ncbi:ferric reduction oxidase 4-like [Cynara cardunculus var. scolymus]|uniref:ferric reduction oxidase 4-like n=1 Tax=Cynara cardunculus var. scolymus TaxID=59895 RepID=UPI000D62E00B|nr:ferric reduction oxidase 4-like [Cynara cardunculus var. scolymus]
MERLTAVRMVLLLVFVGWLFMWVMLPTKTYKDSWKLTLSARLGSTYFREQGTNLLLFSFPIMFLASLGCVYLHFQKKSCPESNLSRRSWLDSWNRPLIVMNPLGIVSAMELMFAAMFVVLLGWSLGNYLYVSFGHLHMHTASEKVWEAKFRSVGLRLGYIGNITWAFLFFPVTRGSSILQLVGLTSESSVKYHIWLGHLSMVLFTAHSVGFIIYWAITDQMALMLEWSRTYVSNVAGEIAFILALVMWVTSIPRVRRKMFELFFYAHQTYILYLFFYIIHVGVAYFCLILPGIFLFLIDRYLRFLQSRTNVRVVAARLLPCDTLELNFTKIAGLDYNPASILFLNVPSISKLQWHPFTVTSNANMEPDMLTVLIKCQGTWSRKLYQHLSGSPIHHLQVSVEGPYGPTSSHFLRYENLVLISGGSGITPFISIIRELTFQRARQEQQPDDEHHKLPKSVVLICAFKNSADLSMLDILLPLTSNLTSRSYLSEINLEIQAYITRETEQPLENTKKPLQTIWFKPHPSDSPISAPLGPNSWLWLCAIISSSFVMFLVLLGILTRYHIYPKERVPEGSVYNYTFKTLWDMFLVCGSVFLATSFVFLWQKKENNKKEGMKVQNLEGDHEVGEEIESVAHRSVLETTEVHFSRRPDLKSILMEKNKKGSATGVLVSGPRNMRHEVAKICSSPNQAKNLHLEAMSFNW